MGTTLTNNVYLPDEGERNCYSGLAQNWQILDDAVGAIAGKANASHTHGNITNDGAIGSTSGLPIITGTDGVLTTGTFGTASGTFCEGNDSRLSDARTPVAHTHTKSDVTDLLNSNFIPSANNTYDLGSSSYQWNNLYAKNYYYKGTQWGLDQNNTWTGSNTYTSYIKSIGQYRSDTWSTNARDNLYLMARRDTEDVSGWLVNTFRANTEQGTAGHIYGWDLLENGIRYSGLRFSMIWDSTLNNGNGGYKILLRPNNQGTNPCTYFGIESLKEINGVNPGALSLPDISGRSELTTEKGSWSVSGSRNTYTPTVNGWIFIRVSGSTKCSINIHLGSSSNAYPTSYHEGESLACMIFPMVANVPLYVYVYASTIEELWIMPSLGNV